MVKFPLCGLRLHLSAFLIGSFGLLALYSVRHRGLSSFCSSFAWSKRLSDVKKLLGMLNLDLHLGLY